MNIENASQNDEPSIKNTFIPNGMLGKIIDIYDEIIPYTNEHKTGAIIDFDGVRVKYEKSEMSMLLLGYAISIHKSQGGSAKVTITLTPSCHAYMMNSNLLYVALTRTKEKCFHLLSFLFNLIFNFFNISNKKVFLLKFSFFLMDLFTVSLSPI